MIRNDFFFAFEAGLLNGYKSNFTAAQRKVLQELKQDDAIIICPADKGKAVVVADRETYLAKTVDQIHEENYKITKKEKRLFYGSYTRSL